LKKEFKQILAKFNALDQQYSESRSEKTGKTVKFKNLVDFYLTSG